MAIDNGFYTTGLPAAPLITGIESIPLETNLTNGINPATAAATTTQLASYFGGGLPWVAGRIYGMPRGTTPVAILTATATLYAYPVYIPNAVNVATLNISTTTGQTGAVAHAGIYADNGLGYPGALVYDTGVITLATSSNAVNTKTPATPIALNAGWYWLATIFSASGTFPSVSGITANYGVETNAQLGSDTVAHALATSGQAATGISVAGTYGALPATYTSGATLTLNAATPIVFLGV